MDIFPYSKPAFDLVLIAQCSKLCQKPAAKNGERVRNKWIITVIQIYSSDRLAAFGALKAVRIENKDLMKFKSAAGADAV